MLIKKSIMAYRIERDIRKKKQDLDSYSINSSRILYKNIPHFVKWSAPDTRLHSGVVLCSFALYMRTLSSLRLFSKALYNKRSWFDDDDDDSGDLLTQSTSGRDIYRLVITESTIYCPAAAYLLFR